ncbi:hypothetical protein QTQ03_29430 [Micromonospora sp. WMMA1363]|uniref:hypothetical protein n=1 Tax=Micromonospora sp. WMMA1363 TaxID=3053985 RepID=UPI00259D0EFF|nr:hypothetical protein [Micromonospora sp. WMMA1363]MDM4723502.1 hypothetical protein [Micromonospora sp. WMMA1363]
MTTDPAATRAYLTATLDQARAAARDNDQAAADAVTAKLIQDDRPDARQAIADALRLHAARHDQPSRDSA